MPIAIPYEKQDNPSVRRGCGAAALAMVYRSFGKDLPQTEIWPLISQKNRFASLASTTHLMALHALSQDLSALIIQARDPIQVLRICQEKGIRAILNHRPQQDAPNGHYTVLTGVDDKSVTVHDPASGPSRQMTHQELLQLWLPLSDDSEIAGNVIIGIAQAPPAVPACEFCHTAIPDKIRCPNCRRAVRLSPAALLGCARDGCVARTWNYVACPRCDYMWAFDESGTSTGTFTTTKKSGAGEPEAPDLDAVFAQLDKFCALMLSSPEAANHPDVKAQIDFIQASKETMRSAWAKDVASQKADAVKMEAFEREAKRKMDVHRKKQEASSAPAADLDGMALAEALLKNLRFK